MAAGHLWSAPSPRMKVLACAVAASAIMRLALEMSPSCNDSDCDRVQGPSSANLRTQAGVLAEPQLLPESLRCRSVQHSCNYR